MFHLCPLLRVWRVTSGKCKSKFDQEDKKLLVEEANSHFSYSKNNLSVLGEKALFKATA